ncbi:hypothetical protein EVAR_48294_1 [Eumeta japonica]|uniref:Uncharacterized protein n=1 Tax=Eumeta variegata TaxID=151549 RepID=A0A4C1WK97_EUMVA|nr:hypothetical protein EVAR_48294_1 [Eumeta japonica]
MLSRCRQNLPWSTSLQHDGEAARWMSHFCESITEYRRKIIVSVLAFDQRVRVPVAHYRFHHPTPSSIKPLPPPSPHSPPPSEIAAENLAPLSIRNNCGVSTPRAGRLSDETFPGNLLRMSPRSSAGTSREFVDPRRVAGGLARSHSAAARIHLLPSLSIVTLSCVTIRRRARDFPTDLDPTSWHQLTSTTMEQLSPGTTILEGTVQLATTVFKGRTFSCTTD